MSSYYLTAVVLVLAIPVVALAALVGLVRWARDSIARAPAIGVLGVLCTASALVNLFLARACGDGVNRPIIAAAIGDPACQRVGVASIQVVLLLVVATAAVTRLADAGRRAAGDGLRR